MKKSLYFIFLLALLFPCGKEITAQATCEGTIQASALPAFGSGIQIGDGTPGNIQVCITSNSLTSGGGSCMGAGQVVLGNTISTQVGAGTFIETTADGTCFTFSTGTGIGFLSQNCFGAGSEATMTWTTVDGSGNPVCASCSDGIQNQGETGIDCGGPCVAICPPATCSDGILNQDETGIDCGGSTCPACTGPVCCTFSLNMDDSFGDGWDGALIDIIVDGVEILTNETAVGFGSTVTFPVCEGESVEYNYTSGSFEAEHSFSITDADGGVITSSAAPIAVGQFTATASAVCPISCTDGIMNQDETGVDCGGTFCVPCHCTNGVLDGDETAIDCGGSCDPCATCFDGIQNGSETDIDCGGSCAIACGTNSVAVTSTCGACPVGASATVYSSHCDQVGTSAYNLNSPTVDFVGCASFTAPSPAPTCAVATLGTWIQVDLGPGVTQVQLAFNSGAVANGNNNTWAAAYQGSDCGTLAPTAGGCQNAVYFISGAQYVNQVFFTGLDPNLPLWIFMFNDAGKTFSLNFDLIGTGGPPTNTTCATADAVAGEGCNLGAPGNTDLITPGANGIACDGGNWGSNENTTFYSFTPTATTGSLTIDNIVCNDGSSGNLQFAVFEDCSIMSTNYNGDPGFLGCVVGTATLSLTGLTVGQTYYMASDGFAGDNCAWSFTGINLVLPIDLLKFTGEYVRNTVELNWITATETNNDFFTLERSKDGVSYEAVTQVAGAGNSASAREYTFVDHNPYEGISYYRLSQTDYNATTRQVGVVAVRGVFTIENLSVQPNPVGENGKVVFNSGQRGMYNLNIVDLHGRILSSQEFEVSDGINSIDLKIDALPSGMYFVSIGKDASYRNIRFVKN